MTEFNPYFTNDGSVGLFNKEFNDIYHSATGALTESFEKFIYPFDFDIIRNYKEFNVLDICFGIGYNTKAFLDALKNNYEKNNISSIHTNNSLSINNIYNKSIDGDKIFNKRNLHSSLLPYSNVIHVDNILPVINITAVDIDKNLALLSPFVKTNKKIYKNTNLTFEYNKIYKYLNNDQKLNTKKIDSLINYFLLQNLLNDYDSDYKSEELNNILKEQKFRPYFDNNMKGVFANKGGNIWDSHDFLNLHNIYYKYISSSYKRRLKTSIYNNINFELKIDDARKILKESNKIFDLVFLDAFTPTKCPCLWSVDFFRLLYSKMSDNSVLFTYSNSASIRNAFIHAGFSIGKIFNSRLNEFVGTVATKNKRIIKYELSDFDLGLLKTRAGIFYQDKNLTALNDEILRARENEVNLSSLPSASQYRKKHSE